MELPFSAQEETCGECFQGGCTVNQHFLEDGDLDRRYGEGNHGCMSDYCSVTHPQGGAACWEASLDIEQQQKLFELVIDPNTNLKAALASFGDAAVYNAERQAVQVKGCGGSVIMSLPLTPEQILTF